MKDFELNNKIIAGIYKNLDRSRFEVEIEKSTQGLSAVEARKLANWLYDAAKHMEKQENPEMHLTPKERAERAYEQIRMTQALNKRICEIGACIHKEHHK